MLPSLNIVGLVWFLVFDSNVIFTVKIYNLTILGLPESLAF